MLRCTRGGGDRHVLKQRLYRPGLGLNRHVELNGRSNRLVPAVPILMHNASGVSIRSLHRLVAYISGYASSPAAWADSMVVTMSIGPSSVLQSSALFHLYFCAHCGARLVGAIFAAGLTKSEPEFNGL